LQQTPCAIDCLRMSLFLLHSWRIVSSDVGFIVNIFFFCHLISATSFRLPWIQLFELIFLYMMFLFDQFQDYLSSVIR
jgi:hypothetical protein